MEKRFKLTNRSVSTPAGGASINLRCPECHQMGTFELLRNTHDIVVQSQGTFNGSLWVGYRVCPNTTCNLLMFVAFHQTRQPSGMHANVLVSYPAERIDFDATKVPQTIVNALEEAITCHANSCHVAAAIMVRKALEELCHDQNASGNRLVDQIKDLKNKVIIPTGLLDGIDNLRLLGNDAAHVELKDFDQIGAEEAEVGILFTKELLKAVYQSSLIAERLGALKK